MTNLFLSKDAQYIFRNKKVVVVGDSVFRGIYKDLVCFLQGDRLLDRVELKSKGEAHFCNDSLIFRTILNNGPGFTEVREYQSADGYHLVQYYFVTRAYNKRVEEMLKNFEQEPPDIVIMNSCQWDLSRYRSSIEEDCDDNESSRKLYCQNLNTLLTRLHSILKPSSIFLWCTALPLASKIVGGFLLNNVKLNSEPLRVFILEGNYEAAQIVTSYGFDVLDLHYYMRSQLRHREPDGVHWKAVAHRHITELILTFLCDTWGMPLPSYTVDILKTNEKMSDTHYLPHLQINGQPDFLRARLQRLEQMSSMGIVD